MKKALLLILLQITTVSCTKDENVVSPCEDQLPAITTNGANTFGCCINGNLLKPRDGSGTYGGSDFACIIWGDVTGNEEYFDIDVHDFASDRTGKINIHTYNVELNGVGNYVVDISNGQRGIDSYQHTNIYCRVFDNKKNQYQYYNSYNNSGVLKIERYDYVNKIVSGTFNCKVINSSNSNDTIQIKDGRFDFNFNTLYQTTFP